MEISSLQKLDVGNFLSLHHIYLINFHIQMLIQFFKQDKFVSIVMSIDLLKKILNLFVFSFFDQLFNFVMSVLLVINCYLKIAQSINRVFSVIKKQVHNYYVQICIQIFVVTLSNCLFTLIRKRRSEFIKESQKFSISNQCPYRYIDFFGSLITIYR